MDDDQGAGEGAEGETREEREAREVEEKEERKLKKKAEQEVAKQKQMEEMAEKRREARRIQEEEERVAKENKEAARKKADEEREAFFQAQKIKAAEEAEKKRILEEQAAARKAKAEARRKAMQEREDYLKGQAAKVPEEGFLNVMIEAAITGDMEEWRELADEWDGNDIMLAQDEDGWSPLTWLCKKGHHRCFMYSLDKWYHDWDPTEMQPLIKERINTRDPDGQSYLHFAAIAGSADLIRYLLDKGAGKDAGNDDGFTALHFAGYVNM